jgi:hypothetical protein
VTVSKRTKKNNVPAGYQHAAQELWILHIYAHCRTPQCGLGYNMHAATFSGTFMREASRGTILVIPGFLQMEGKRAWNTEPQ